MNNAEIKKCPLCGGNAYAETTIGFGQVRVAFGCVPCHMEITKTTKLENDDDIIQVMNQTFKSVLNTWNKRAEEPRKETNIEWLIDNLEVAKEAAGANIPCKIVRYVKYGKPCDAPFPDDYCNECEFYEKCGNNKAILLEVLAEPHHEENK